MIRASSAYLVLYFDGHIGLFLTVYFSLSSLWFPSQYFFPSFSLSYTLFSFSFISLYVTHLSLTFHILPPTSPSSSFLPLGHSHPMDMPGRGLYDERDSGIARSGKLIRLGAKAWIDLHSMQHSVLQLSFELGLHLFLSRSTRKRNRKLLNFWKLLSHFQLKNVVPSHKWGRYLVLIIWFANTREAANEFFFFLSTSCVILWL